MRFSDWLRELDLAAVRRQMDAAGPDDVDRLLRQEGIDDEFVPLLFSRAADSRLEDLAQRSAALTRLRFGRVVQLYAPLYLSNECYNQCTYCGFSRELDIPRVTLDPGQVQREAARLHAQGFRHVLLVSGEDRRVVDMPYLLECVDRLQPDFESIAIEIQPLEREEYETLAARGVDGLALYQECYDPKVYRRHHLGGPKQDYWRRLDHMDEGGEAGFRTLGIGSLLGLSDWRLEATLVVWHGRWLSRRHWRSRVSVSFPRIQDCAQAAFRPEFPVTDRDLVHLVCATRLALPDAELVMSTRESARLRDPLLGLGITRTSAGSRTDPGGYGEIAGTEGEQFDVEDQRSPAEVAQAIAARGLEPVWKDFDRSFMESG